MPVENVTITGKMARMNEAETDDRPVVLQPSLDEGWVVIKPPIGSPFKVDCADLIGATSLIKRKGRKYPVE